MLRREAKTEGERYYTGGKACPRCGGFVRYTSTGQCRGCHLRRPEARSKDVLREQARKRYATDPSKYLQKAAEWRAANPEKMAKCVARWAQAHKPLLKARTSARSRRTRQATPLWVNKKELQAVYQQAIQRSLSTGVKYHVDHIVPLKSDCVCGLHVPWNLQLLTAADNCRKKNTFNKAGSL